MHVKNGSKGLKRYPQISRRVRDTLARLLLAKCPTSEPPMCTHKTVRDFLFASRPGPPRRRSPTTDMLLITARPAPPSSTAYARKSHHCIRCECLITACHRRPRRRPAADLRSAAYCSSQLVFWPPACVPPPSSAPVHPPPPWRPPSARRRTCSRLFWRRSPRCRPHGKPSRASTRRPWSWSA